MSNESLRFFIDQVVKQYQDLKQDFRIEIGNLRLQLSKDAERAMADLKDFKDESNEKFEHLEDRISKLEAFSWKLIGAASAAMFVIEVLIRVAEYYIHQ